MAEAEEVAEEVAVVVVVADAEVVTKVRPLPRGRKERSIVSNLSSFVRLYIRSLLKGSGRSKVQCNRPRCAGVPAERPAVVFCCTAPLGRPLIGGGPIASSLSAFRRSFNPTGSIGEAADRR